jgi:hypothetical protein
MQLKNKAGGEDDLSARYSCDVSTEARKLEECV